MAEPTFVFHPGEFLSDELEARGRTQKNFAYILGISPAYLNEIIKGKKNLTPELCIRIGEAFGTTANVWWNLQNEYSLITAKQREEKCGNENIKGVHQRVKESGYELVTQEDTEKRFEEQKEQPPISEIKILEPVFA